MSRKLTHRRATATTSNNQDIAIPRPVYNKANNMMRNSVKLMNVVNTDLSVMITSSTLQRQRICRVVTNNYNSTTTTATFVPRYTSLGTTTATSSVCCAVATRKTTISCASSSSATGTYTTSSSTTTTT